MKLWVLVGLLTSVAAPALAEETQCPEDQRMARQEMAPPRVEGAPAIERPSKEDLLTPTVVAERERIRERARKHPQTLQAGGVPDSVLIGGSGAL